MAEHILLKDKRCNIGEGPIWNEKEESLYFTNGFGGNEICIYKLGTKKLGAIQLPFSVAAVAFNTEYEPIVSHSGGVHILKPNNTLCPIYDENIYEIKYANDMKVGPDGAIYVGTQSEKRKGISDKINGKLYRILPDGNVTVLLEDISLSNGMDWSMDEKKFYHTDSDTSVIKEYNFDKNTGEISYSGRSVKVLGVDGFCIGKDERIYAACWGEGHIAVIDTKSLEIKDYIKTEFKIPTSCAFAGANMEYLAITSSSAFADIEADKSAGYTALIKTDTTGRKPCLFGEK